jgi:hypothetical protein
VVRVAVIAELLVAFIARFNEPVELVFVRAVLVVVVMMIRVVSGVSSAIRASSSVNNRLLVIEVRSGCCSCRML